jgi:hypothetical protein
MPAVPYKEHANRRRAATCPPRRPRGGQVAVFLLLLLTALGFVLLWNIDTHRIITTKMRAQNAGDAAALAGARWQGIGLNLVGELNLLHALALSTGDASAVDAITNVQARVLFTAPLMGLAAAQVAAKNNGMYAEDEFTQLISQHAQEVRQYDTLVGGVPIFAPPYETAWADYADMLEALAGDGIAAGPDNSSFYDDSTGGHVLRDRAFYDAVAGETWCWFYNNQMELLQNYNNYQWWPPLPGPTPTTPFNSEFLDLRLRPVALALDQIITNRQELLDEAQREGVDMSNLIASNVFPRTETWYVYDGGAWGSWDLLSTSGDEPFPVTGPVRAKYNYAGADAMFRVLASVERQTPGLAGATNVNSVIWTAAAKPFGAVGPVTARKVPCQYGLVLPAFSDVRLIPVDACSGSGNGSFDIEWRRHLDEHLPAYLAEGPQSSGCWYCQQLVTWESGGTRAFQQEGLDWLAVNSGQCTPRGGSGGSRGGGRRRGH